jgi:hypothetical protein
MKKQTLNEEISRMKNMMRKLMEESESWDVDFAHRDNYELNDDGGYVNPGPDMEEDLSHIDVELVPRKIKINDLGYVSDKGNIETYSFDLYINGEESDNDWGFDVETYQNKTGIEGYGKVDIVTITHPITDEKVKIWVGGKKERHRRGIADDL